MKRVIVTGFGGFGDIKINPASLVAEKVANKLNSKFPNLNISYFVIKVSNDEILKFVNAQKNIERTFFLHFGLDDSRDHVVFEKSAKIKSEKLTTKVDLEKFVDKHYISDDAGTFECNYLYYQTLNLTDKVLDAYSLFVHVPTLNSMKLQDQVDFILDRIVPIIFTKIPLEIIASTRKEIRIKEILLDLIQKYKPPIFCKMVEIKEKTMSRSFPYIVVR